MAEREGFEPSIRYKRIHTFQACAFNHSATSPNWRENKLDSIELQQIVKTHFVSTSLIVEKLILLYNKGMNLLGKILRSSQRGKPRPWYSHRYIGRFLLLIMAIFCYEYYSYSQPRTFQQIIESKVLKVGYIKAPDVAFESNLRPLGFQHDVLTLFAETHSLEIDLIEVNQQDAFVALNNNSFDILIGHFPAQTGQSTHVFSQQVKQSPLKALLTTKDMKSEGEHRLWTPYYETSPWHTTRAVIFEHKEPNTPKTRRIPTDEPIYFEAGFPTHIPSLSQYNLKPINSQISLLENASKNNVQFGITSLTRLRISQNTFSSLRRIASFSEPISLVWLLSKKPDQYFLAAINNFLESKQLKKFAKQQENIWKQKFLHLEYLDLLSINRRIDSALPQLKPLFESAGSAENIDWTLLAALAYQESRWNLDAVSPTKVRGIMQLTKTTAKTLGVKDRTDAYESIHAAARYLKKLEQIIPIQAKRSDRIWMAVAAYNLGIGRIMQAYRYLREYQENEITWLDMANQLTTRSEYFQNDQYSTGKRAVEYVERIREFQKILRYYSSQKFE